MKKYRHLGFDLLAVSLILGTAACSPSASTPSPESPRQTPSVKGQSPSAQKPAVLTHPQVALETNLGTIVLSLDNEKAPQTVENFLAYVNKGFYDQTIVHQVFQGQGIVAGGYTADYKEKPARTPVYNEAENGLKNLRGTIAMARLADAADSATSQFFINVADNPELDHRDRTPAGYGYCVFGKVVQGMEVVDKIANSPVQDKDRFERTPVEPVIIKSARCLK
jgi:cyclophilin family peptidyl-prolyl cis-trans isomerase